jgi:hypothetical protein
MDWREVMYGQAAVEDEEVAAPADVDAQPTGRPKPTGKANRLAVTALILAGLAPFLVGGILATVFGMVALDEIDESNGTERGGGIAKWAIGLGFVNIAASCLLIVLVVKTISS